MCCKFWEAMKLSLSHKMCSEFSVSSVVSSFIWQQSAAEMMHKVAGFNLFPTVSVGTQTRRSAVK